VRCLTASERAMAAERDDDDPHLADCLACRAAVTEQRAIRALVRRAPAPPLPRARREAIAAEVLSRSYPQPSGRRTWLARGGLIGAGLAAAAAVLALALWPAPRATVARVELALGEDLEDTAAPVVRGVIAEVAPDRPARRPALVRPGGAAELTRLTVEDREVLELRNGTLTVDARDAREVEITMRGTTVHVEDAKICVSASAGVIGTVTVFAGSAEVTSRGKLVVVEAGMVWVPDAVGPSTALREFRAGWAALRDGSLRVAVGAFDRARDPVVAEDAAYWSGVAAERLGDRRDAARRFAGFLDLFPASPHADSARIALARVTH
jgi:hypothetical protein